MATKSPKKAKAPAAHPKYQEMIAAAISSLASKSGSSKPAIAKYISANYKVGDRHDSLLRSALLRGLKGGALVKKTGVGCSGSFKLAPVVAPKKKKVVAKKPKVKAAAKKKKPAAKKPAAKKAATPKKKVAPKKKVTPKKKAAPKKAAKKAAPKKAAPKKAKK